MAAVDYFLKIDGIEGESKDQAHQGEIDIDYFAWGESQTGSHATGGGGGAGKVRARDVRLVMKTCKASPKLMLACASGQHFPKAELVLRKAGKQQQEYSKWTFTDVLVSAYEISGLVPRDLPRDEVNLNFAKVELEYKEQKADGTLGSPVKAGWDVKANKAV
jgi:type VI secretion system secreted protein Hcp